jgi:GINS complex subunit 1
MYGETANKLVDFTTLAIYSIRPNESSQVQNAKRTLSLPHLPPYSSDAVRSTVREVRDLDRDVSSILAPFGSSFNPSADPSTACALLVNHLCMRRNKRCLLAYHKVRTEKLEGYCWEGVDVLEAQGGGANGGNEGAMNSKKGGEESSLSPEEEEYVRQYSDLLAAYKGQWTDIDLTGSLDPPKDLFIDVRVLKDAGEIQTEYGYARPSRMIA